MCESPLAFIKRIEKFFFAVKPVELLLELELCLFFEIVVGNTAFKLADR